LNIKSKAWNWIPQRPFDKLIVPHLIAIRAFVGLAYKDKGHWV
jgi:hypothetical protein